MISVGPVGAQVGVSAVQPETCKFDSSRHWYPYSVCLVPEHSQRTRICILIFLSSKVTGRLLSPVSLTPPDLKYKSHTAKAH